MERFQKIVCHETYKQTYEKLQELEKDREFCGHDMEHFLRVGQIAILLAKENGLSIDAEEIMLAALFHDLGRALQYQNGISHAESSAILAEEILLSIGYDPAKTDRICAAVKCHSKRQDVKIRYAKRGDLKTLEDILSFADHFSRECFACAASDTCKWKAEERIDRPYFEIKEDYDIRKRGML